MKAATFFDGTAWREGVVELADGRVRLRDERPTPDLPASAAPSPADSPTTTCTCSSSSTACWQGRASAA